MRTLGVEIGAMNVLEFTKIDSTRNIGDENISEPSVERWQRRSVNKVNKYIT